MTSISAAMGAARSLFAPAGTNPYENSRSAEFGFRSARFVHVRQLIETILAEKGHAEILDLGGTETYWLIGREFVQANRERLRFTLVNPLPLEVDDRRLFTALEGDATGPSLFPGRKFDLVHSNSVIEHVGDWQEFEAFAANVRRLAPRYFVQTPNYWFPFEPHFRFPGFQYLPRHLRAFLLTRARLGFFDRIGSMEEALDIVRHHRLLDTGEMRRLFPDATVLHEKLGGLNKSIMAVRD